MKKVVAYIGTRKGEDSNTYKLTKVIFDKCRENSENIQFEIITSNDFVINNCVGCGKCFRSGVCSLDKVDEASKLKEKLLAADMVVFASPVYAHNVSGDMKTFIDRISYWLHNMKLNGKYAAVISTTLSNGHLTVTSYLEKIMNILGTNILFKINATVSDPEEFMDEEWIDKKSEELSYKIITALNTPITSNSVLENVFKGVKARYEDMEKNGYIFENYKEIAEQGLFISETYQEFLDNYHNKCIKNK